MSFDPNVRRAPHEAVHSLRRGISGTREGYLGYLLSGLMARRIARFYIEQGGWWWISMPCEHLINVRGRKRRYDGLAEGDRHDGYDIGLSTPKVTNQVIVATRAKGGCPRYFKKRQEQFGVMGPEFFQKTDRSTTREARLGGDGSFLPSEKRTTLPASRIAVAIGQPSALRNLDPGLELYMYPYWRSGIQRHNEPVGRDCGAWDARLDIGGMPTANAGNEPGVVSPGPLRTLQHERRGLAGANKAAAYSMPSEQFCDAFAGFTRTMSWVWARCETVDMEVDSEFIIPETLPKDAGRPVRPSSSGDQYRFAVNFHASRGGFNGSACCSFEEYGEIQIERVIGFSRRVVDKISLIPAFGSTRIQSMVHPSATRQLSPDLMIHQQEELNIQC
ncbi:hypothetical protein BD779DRAFT_1471870 [Infundibulicybe gibba]|nr:hypothetical protein BD779DRAFT_1471870 [Infundibulicybe gibba]